MCKPEREEEMAGPRPEKREEIKPESPEERDDPERAEIAAWNIQMCPVLVIGPKQT